MAAELEEEAEEEGIEQMIEKEIAQNSTKKTASTKRTVNAKRLKVEKKEVEELVRERKV